MRKLIIILAWIIFTGSTAFAFPPVMPQAPGSALITFDQAVTFGSNLILPDAGTIKLTSSTTDAKYSGTSIVATAGEILAFGELVYRKSDSKVWKADADAVASMPCVGIVVVAGAAEAQVTILLTGVVTDTDWNWTVGQRLYVSETAGGIENTVGNISDANDVVQIIGVAWTADTILFNPSLVEVVL